MFLNKKSQEDIQNLKEENLILKEEIKKLQESKKNLLNREKSFKEQIYTLKDQRKVKDNVIKNRENSFKKQIYTLRDQRDKLNILYNNELNYQFKYSLQKFLIRSMQSFLLPFEENLKEIITITDLISDNLIKEVPNEKPLVSVIMPVYNRENFVIYAIESILNQTYDNLEFIIIDDASTDSTIERITQYNDSRIKLIKHEKNRGAAASRNSGLKISKGKYIMYLDSDNVHRSKYIETMVGAFTVLKDADVIYSGQYIYEGNRDNLTKIKFRPLNRGSLINKDSIDLNVFCHTRKMYEYYGGFDNKIKIAEDWDIILKYMTYGKIYSIPVFLSNYYFNITKNALSDNDDVKVYNDIVVEIEEKRLKNKKKDKKLINKFVIILFASKIENFKKCLMELLDIDLKLIVELIVITENLKINKEYLQTFKKINNIKIKIQNEVSISNLLSNINCDVLIIRDSALITDGTIEELQHATYNVKDCGVTVPQQIMPAGSSEITKHVYFSREYYPCDINISDYYKNVINLPLFYNGEYTELSMTSSFCVYLKKDVVIELGKLDLKIEDDINQDIVYSNYIREVLGYKIYHVSRALVYHD